MFEDYHLVLRAVLFVGLFGAVVFLYQDRVDDAQLLDVVEDVVNSSSK